MTKDLVTLYEVYDKRALYEPLATLPLLDRDRDVKKALASARAWGGLIMKISARITQAYPLKRDIITAQVHFIHTPRPDPPEPRDRITIKELKGQIRRHKHPHLRKKPRH
jgi:hypothetical protein